jgi:hypothetical protein
VVTGLTCSGWISIIRAHTERSPVAQSVEQLTVNQLVASSSLARGAIFIIELLLVASFGQFSRCSVLVHPVSGRPKGRISSDRFPLQWITGTPHHCQDGVGHHGLFFTRLAAFSISASSHIAE